MLSGDTGMTKYEQTGAGWIRTYRPKKESTWPVWLGALIGLVVLVGIFQ